MMALKYNNTLPLDTVTDSPVQRQVAVACNYHRRTRFIRFLSGLICMVGLAASPQAQEILGDVMSGKLVNPEVGVYAWYTLEDKSEERVFYLRQAIVDEERIRLRRGHWVETEIIPQIGFPAVYKMLLTGPASDPRNMHRMLLKEGTQEPVEIDVEAMQEEAEEDGPESEVTRTLVGSEVLELPQGQMEADHYILEQDGRTTEIWVNDAVRPMGIIRMLSENGELMLLRYGKGGEDGMSAFDRESTLPDPGEQHRMEVEVNPHPQGNGSGPNTNFRGRSQD